MITEKTARIRALNDELRLHAKGGKRVISRRVADMGPMYVYSCIEAVRAFDAFSEANDPHGEHDFGALEVWGISVFWKIDYYDPALEVGSPAPDDPTQCGRVLIIMFADEY